MLRSLAALITTLALLAGAPAATAAPVDTGHLDAELVSQAQGVAPGQTIQVALRQKIDKGWHTYWRNAGDSGEPTSIAWTLPPGWKAGEFTWPAPERQPTGPLVNYGYSGEVLLPMAVTAPSDARPGDIVVLQATANFLVCEEICIPESAQLSLDLPVTAAPAPADPKWGPRIAQTLAAAPRPAGLNAAFAYTPQALKLAVTGAPLKAASAADAHFFPFDGTVIDHAKPQAVELGPEGLTLTLIPGVAFQAPTPPAAMAGVLTLEGRAYEISAAPGPLPAGAAGLGPPKAASPAAGSGIGLAAAALFAFLGGVVLNLMPCVFPVLAMKATSLARHADERTTARRQGLAFLAGVLATFLALAGALIAVRAGGAAVGWGFQLQSPPIVAGLALLMLAVALNLSGVFEIGQSLQGAGSDLASRKGLAGAFFTGALAVVVAAPCTAPFMGPAMGWALTQSAPAALTVFAALGLGFAAPFTLAALAPGLLARLPKPGPWMEMFRRLMAFPMYGAAAWLAWVLAAQAGQAGLARILAAGVALGLAAWLYGRWQRATAGGRSSFAFAAAGAAALVLGLGVALTPGYTAVASSGAGAARDSTKLPYEAWSVERLAAARAEGRPVFVNFTAAWCVSCQVNERVALSTDKVAKAFAATNAVYLKGDWTRKDAVIEAELARHGRAGVPLYLVYDAKGGEGVVLPQLLTPDMVVRAVEAAKAREN